MTSGQTHEDEKVVRQTHPRAYCDRIVGGQIFRIINGKGPALSKDCSTEAEAWADSRRRIDSLPPQAAPESICKHTFNIYGGCTTCGVRKDSSVVADRERKLLASLSRNQELMGLLSMPPFRAYVFTQIGDEAYYKAEDIRRWFDQLKEEHHG